MTTYSGFRVAVMDRTDSVNHQSINLDTFEVDYWPPHESAMSPALNQTAYIDNLPIGAQENVLAGDYGGSYRDDYYYRIHIRPPLLDLGDVSTDQIRTVEIWNAYLTGQLLDDIVETDTTGLELTEPVAFPTTFAPLESRLYSVKFVGGGGAVADIDAKYDFSFPAETPSLQVTGTQIQLFPFQHNWAYPLVERLEWLTDVIEHYDGSEQCIGLRSLPRRTVELHPVVAGVDRERMAAALWSWGGNVFGVPIWQDVGHTDATALVGESILYVGTAYKDFHSKGLAALIYDTGAYELVEIDQVIGDSITLMEPLRQNWMIGSRICPVRAARLETTNQVSGLSGWIDDISVRFRFLDLFAYTVTPSVHTYRTYPVLQVEPNWREGTDITLDRKMEIIDNLTTFPVWDDESGRPARAQTYRFTYRGRDNIDGVYNWLHEREGRRVPCWMNSGQNDLTLTTPILASDVSIRVQNIGYVRLLHEEIGRRDICIRLHDGTYFYRHITGSIEVSGEEEQLSIGSELSQDVAIEDVAAISWLDFSRLDADSVEVAWYSTEIIETVFAMRGRADDV